MNCNKRIDRNFNPRRTVAASLALAALLAACSGPEERKAEYMQRGKQFLAQENYVKARLELKNVLQIDPRATEAYYLMGNIEETEGNVRGAFANYLKVAELDPAHVPAQVKLAHIYALGGRQEDALEIIGKVLALEPKHLEARTLKAAITAREGDTGAAMTEVQAVLAEAGDHTNAAILMASLKHREGDRAGAEQTLLQAVDLNPDSAPVRIALANLLLEDKRHDAAEQALKDVVALEPDNLAHVARLVNFYQTVEQPQKAEQLLRDNVEAQPQNIQRVLMLTQYLAKQESVEAAVKELSGAITRLPQEHSLRFALAELHEAARQFDDAKRVYGEIVTLNETGPQRIQARIALSKLHVKLGEEEKASALVQEVLTESPGDVDALLVRGQLALGSGQLDNAVADLRSVVRHRPADMDVLRLLATAHQRAQQYGLALESLQKVLELSPEDLDARVAMAQVALTLEDTAMAQQQLDTVLKKKPDHAGALRFRIDAYVADERWDDAAKTADKLKTAHPDAAVGYYKRGQVHVAQKELTAAVTEFEAAAARSPAGDPTAFTALIETLVADKREDEAVKRIQQVIDAGPDNFVAHNMLGEVYMAAGKPDKAGAAFDKALELKPDWDAPYANKARIALSSGDVDAAIALYERGREAVADRVRLSLLLAAAYERVERWDDAAAVYDQLLRDDPTLDVAANNLAVILSDYKGDPESLQKAVTLARRFEASDNPLYLDTLGWAYYKAGQMNQAVTVLERAHAIKPIPVLQFHLGMANLGSGDRKRAKQMLEQALQAKADFPGLDQAKQALAEM